MRSWLTTANSRRLVWRLLQVFPGRLLSHDSASFHTASGADLPFTYPPLSAIMFTPFTWLSYHAASVVITVITLVLLVVSTMIVLGALEVWPTSAVSTGPAWARRGWLRGGVGGVGVFFFWAVPQ